jgi:superoxide reductase
MAQFKEIYKCEVCGNIIEVLHAGSGKVVCCGKEMKLFKENTVDAAVEKHVPVVDQKGSAVTVKVGSIEHPMEEKHYIEFIEVMTDAKIYRQYLKPGEKPVAEFEVAGAVVSVREYCNLHGLWKN